MRISSQHKTVVQSSLMYTGAQVSAPVASASKKVLKAVHSTRGSQHSILHILNILHTGNELSNIIKGLLLLSSLPSAVPTMRLSQDTSRLPFCLFFGRFTSPGSFWIFFSFRSSLT